MRKIYKKCMENETNQMKSYVALYPKLTILLTDCSERSDIYQTKDWIERINDIADTEGEKRKAIQEFESAFSHLVENCDMEIRELIYHHKDTLLPEEIKHYAKYIYLGGTTEQADIYVHNGTFSMVEDLDVSTLLEEAPQNGIEM